MRRPVAFENTALEGADIACGQTPSLRHFGTEFGEGDATKQKSVKRNAF